MIPQRAMLCVPRATFSRCSRATGTGGSALPRAGPGTHDRTARVGQRRGRRLRPCGRHTAELEVLGQALAERCALQQNARMLGSGEHRIVRPVVCVAVQVDRGPLSTVRLAAAGAVVEITCTDIAPNQLAVRQLGATPNVRYHATSISALAVPSTFVGARTMFTALHHFEAAEVRASFGRRTGSWGAVRCVRGHQ